MKKKFLLGIMTTIVLAVLLIGYGYYNLKSNSVYYAKNTPHKEGTEPVLMMLVENLYSVYNPDIKGVKYEFDGNPAIKIFDSEGSQSSYFSFMKSDGGYIFSNKDKNVVYKFNEKFSLIRAYDTNDGFTQISIEDIDENEAKNELRAKYQPILDKQTEPLINLQWIFDRVYRNKFN